MGLSAEAYYRALAIAPKISGSLSIIGSTFILRDIIRRSRTNPLRATQRVVLAMSVADINSSFWTHFLSTWMVPRGDDRAPFAAGTEATCIAQAFLYELFIYAEVCSNVTLAVTYWLTVCRQKSESELGKWYWQILLVGAPFLVGLANSLPKLILAGKSTAYNGYWWCELVAETKADDLLDQIVLAVGFIIVMVSMTALIRYVYVREKRMDRFTSVRRLSSDSNLYRRERTVEVTYQGLMYIAIWFVIVLPTVMVSVFDDRLPKGYVIFWSCLFPMHGLMNAVVYFRPKYLDIRRHGHRRRSAVGVLTHMNLAATLVRISDSIRSSLQNSNQQPIPQTTVHFSRSSEEKDDSKPCENGEVLSESVEENLNDNFDTNAPPEK